MNNSLSPVSTAPSGGSSIIENKLARYSAVAGATLAACAASSDAAIVHVTGSPVSLSGPNSFASWNIDGAGAGEMEFRQSFSSSQTTSPIGSTCIGFSTTSSGATTCTSYTPLYSTFTTTLLNALFASGSTAAIMNATSNNQTVGSSDSFLNFPTVTSFSAPQLPFVNGQQLIGFRFRDGITDLFGWADVTVGPQSLTISEWAYDDTGASIVKGAIPEPSSMALLAAGAAGFGLYRRRRETRSKKTR